MSFTVRLFAFVVVILCVCTVTHFSAEEKLAASNFTRWFIGVLGRESSSLSSSSSLNSFICNMNFAPQKPKIGRIGQPPRSKVYIKRPTANVTLEMRRSWNMARRVDVGRYVWIHGCARRRTYLLLLPATSHRGCVPSLESARSTSLVQHFRQHRV